MMIRDFKNFNNNTIKGDQKFWQHIQTGKTIYFVSGPKNKIICSFQDF